MSLVERYILKNNDSIRENHTNDFSTNTLQVLLESQKVYKFKQKIDNYRDTLIDNDFDNFLKKCEIGKPVQFPNDLSFDGKSSFRMVESRGDLLASFRENLVLIYCKENRIKKSELLSDISVKQLNEDGRKILDDITKIFRKSCLALNKLLLVNGEDEELLKSKILMSNLDFFRELVEKKGWSLDDALEGISATRTFIKNFKEDKELFFENYKSFLAFYGKLIPFSLLVRTQEHKQQKKNWKLQQKDDQSIIISSPKKQRIITSDDWKIWLKTIAANYSLFDIRQEGRFLNNDLSSVYCDMLMTPNRNGLYLDPSDINCLFNQYCSYFQLTSQNTPPIFLFSEQSKKDHGRRERIVSSILDGKWYEVLDRVTDVSPEDLLHQSLFEVDKDPNCNFTIGEFLSQIYPHVVINGVLADNLCIKKLYDLKVVIDSPDGRSRNNGYYHTSRYLIKMNTPQTFQGERFESIEIRIHGADRFSHISNDTNLPCLKVTLISDDGSPVFHYCFFNGNSSYKSDWYKVEDVSSNIVLQGASHIYFTPKEDICGNEC